MHNTGDCNVEKRTLICLFLIFSPTGENLPPALQNKQVRVVIVTKEMPIKH